MRSVHGSDGRCRLALREQLRVTSIAKTMEPSDNSSATTNLSVMSQGISQGIY